MFTKRFKNLPTVWANKAKIIEVTVDENKSKFNGNYRKLDKIYSAYKVINLGEKWYDNFVEAIDVRFYCTDSTCYCCLWIKAKNLSLSGTGRAGGYGYDKKSSAFSAAIANTGISGFPAFSGSGDNQFALRTLCKIFDIKKYQIVEFYG